ncbi:putative nucleotidyltransferase substrate binding domain-containing protein [Geomonas agri]|uniref:putative nucleotidyltransferase substrate binding domain-containing protein n=1 Tax=Geomonas agri TaxID=2873702 RepID=UPI001CD61722|nr:putative nucleotidyltransferase substrate binding domain-containing protein [Geomonas agri]
MPHQIYPPEPSDEQLLSELLGEVHALLPLLDRNEGKKLLEGLVWHTSEELGKLRLYSGREEAIVERIAVETDYTVLLKLHDELNLLEMERFLNFYSVTALHENCTWYRDALAGRALELVAAEMPSPPPVPFALISMGSDGREEQTLITDQDYLIVYCDDGGEPADRYFQEYSRILVERLAEIGFKKCTGGIMPVNDNWRGSLAQWQRRLHAIVRYETEDYGKNMMDLIVLSDARFVAGDAELAGKLVSLIRALLQDYFMALWGMAKAATEMKLALGFLKRFWTEGSGEHKGAFNLKLLAWAPLVMNVRILAINQGIPATSTVRRIELLEKEHSFSANMARGLVAAYRILTKHRILLQIKVIKGIQNDAYYLNPYSLPSDERERMRQALLLIEDLQKTIHTNFSIV